MLARRLAWLVLGAFLCLHGAIAGQQAVNLGQVPNTGQGDTLFVSFSKLNANDTELYASIAGLQQRLAQLGNVSNLNFGTTSGTVADGGVLAGEIGRAQAAEAALAPKASPVFTGTVSLPTLNLTGAGSTGDMSGMSVKVPFTGSVSRPQQVRATDIGVSVLDFGASVGTGGDDSAAINAAIAAASRISGPAAGKVIFPYPPSGNYNVCASPVEIPGATQGLTLEGQSSASVAVRLLPGCTSGITSVLHRTSITGALTQTRVNIDNLTFDGYCGTKYVANLEYTVGTNITRSVFRNAATGGSNVRIGGGYEIHIDGTNRLENMNDAGHTCYNTASDLPLYNLETYSSDSAFPGLIAINAYKANFFNGNGGNNHFHGAHGWGYTAPINLVPQYNFIIQGNADLTSCVADTWTTAGVLLQGYNGTARSDAKVMGCNMFGGAPGTPGIQLDPNLTYATVVYNKMPTTSGIASSTAIDGTNIIRGNDGSALNTPVTANPVLGGDTAFLTANSAGNGIALLALSPNANSPVYINSKGQAPIQFYANGALALNLYANNSAVNSVSITANSAGFGGFIQAIGSDTNISLPLVGKGTSGVLTGVFIRTADPTTGDIPTGQCADWNNTTAATFKHVCNFGGTLRSVAMN